MLNPVNDHPPSGYSNSLPSFRARRAEHSFERPRPHIDVAGSVRRHWTISIWVLLLLLGCGAYVLLRMAKPIYESRSVVYVAPKFPKMLSGDSEVDLPYDSYVQDQMQTVNRYDIIADAISNLPYSVRHRSGPAQPSEIQALQKRIDVKRIGTTYEVSIGITGSRPDGLAETVNVVTNTYIDRARNEEFYGLSDRLKTLRTENERIRNEMRERLQEQAQLMQQLGVATIPPAAVASNPYDSMSQVVRDQLAAARMKREAAEARLTSVLKGGGRNGSAVTDSAADEAIANDPGLAGVRTTLNNRRATLFEEMNGLRPDHPVHQKDMNELASIDLQMNDLQRKAAQQLQEKLLQEVTQTRMVELNLIQELANNQHTATAAAPKFQRAAELGPEVDSLQKASDAIGSRIRDLELESSSPGSIHMSTMAQTPLMPESSRLPIFLLALSVFSLACAVAVPVSIDQFDSRLYTAEDVERVVGFPALGVLLDDREFSKDLVDEYYFRLAAGIDHAVRNSGARTFLFTSTAHGSGTSTVVITLAETLRALNLRVKTIAESEFCVLEGLRSNAPLQSELVLKEQVKASDIRPSPLTLITSGHGHTGHRKEQEPTVLETVVAPAHHTSDPWDVLLIDADPLPISAYTEYLARGVDASVLLVRSSITTKQELERAARLLERLEVAGVAVILNGMSLERSDRALKRDLSRFETSLQQRRSTIASVLHDVASAPAEWDVPKPLSKSG